MCHVEWLRGDRSRQQRQNTGGSTCSKYGASVAADVTEVKGPDFWRPSSFGLPHRRFIPTNLEVSVVGVD